MDGQSATAARERRDAHARRQVRHAAGHWLSDENVPPANKHRMRRCCAFLLVLVATSSIRRGTTRPRPRGQETVSRSVCLAPLLVILSSSHLHTIRPSMGTRIRASARLLVRATSTQETVHYGDRRTRLVCARAAWRTESWKYDTTLGVCVYAISLDSKCFVLDIGGFLDETLNWSVENQSSEKHLSLVNIASGKYEDIFFY